MERIAQMTANWWADLSTALLLSSVGVLIGIGQLLSSGERLTPRVVAGRALCSGGLGIAAGALLLLVPEMSLLAKMGVAALTANLGVSGLERLFQRVIERKA